MSSLEEPIDYESLEDELQEALKADALYQLQNDAKIRAVEQRVPTYDHFKDMVSAAHLKPIERSDIKAKVGVQWNSAASCKTSQASSSNCFHKLPMTMFHKSSNSSVNKSKNIDDVVETRSTNVKNVVPKTMAEFLQTWKKLSGLTSRFYYLLKIRPVLFVEIFRSEIPVCVLGEIIDACLYNLPDLYEINNVIEMLMALSQCKRFELSVSFMTQEQKDTSKLLFDRLLLRALARMDAAAFTDVNELHHRYQVNPD